MTAHTTFAPSALAARNTGNHHRRAVMLAISLVLGPVIGVAIYGANYYLLSQADRPFSPKHHLLKPGGAVGVNMGIIGVLMLCAIFVYPLRKRWGWLQKQGDSRHWLDYHVILGVAAPVFIAFHSSFKFHGVAGIAFWVMVAVAISGLVGRYLYGLVIRRVAEAESSLREYRQILADQTTLPQTALFPFLHLPTQDQAAQWPMLKAVGYVVLSDLATPFRVARLRIRGMTVRQTIASWGGLRPSRNLLLEWVLALAGKHAALSHRMLFLSQLKRVLQLWHVIHRPFSYAFAVLALFHIFIAMLMGFI